MTNDGNTTRNETTIHNGCDEEMNLVEYCRVVWKRKTFILLATVLPVLCVSAALLLLPKNYTITYTYDIKTDTKTDTKVDIKADTKVDIKADAKNSLTINVINWEVNKKNYDILLERFYSEANWGILIGKLREAGLNEYAGQLDRSTQPENYVKLEALPHFLDISQLNITDPENIEKINEMKASLLNIAITIKHIKDIDKITSVIRHNVEEVMPLYITQNQLSESIRECNSRLASIESNRYGLELAIKNNDAVLAELKQITVESNDSKQDSVILQLDIKGENQYLPLSHQIQAAEFKKIQLKKTVKMNEEKHIYYKDLADLNNKILAELDDRLSSNYIIEQFYDFLVSLSGSCEKPQLKDYLNSYIRTIENIISINRPITEKPKVVLIERGLTKKTGVVFVISFSLSVIAAFYLDSLKKTARHN